MLNTLNVSQSGLNAAKTAVENVSNNIANENTPGYKKRVVQLSEIEQMDSRFTGRGVNASESYRITSQYMYDKLLSEESKKNNFEKLSDILGTTEAIFKETAESGLSKDLNRYFQAIENLRANPNSEVHKTALQNQGNIIVDSLQNIYTSIEKQEVLEKKELYENVEKVNDLLNDIGVVNEKIGQHSVASNDLLDKRDQLEKELAKYVDIEVSREDGDYELKIAGATAVRFNTNIRDVNVEEEHTPQIDRFIDASGVGSNITIPSGALNADDVVTYKLNNEAEVSVTFGESLTFDWNGDGTPTTDTVDDTNYLRAMVYKINTNTDTQGLVTAYNGTYALNSNGDKITNDNQDNYLRIESKIDGVEGDFEGRVSVTQYTGTTVDARSGSYKNEDQSTDSTSRVFVSIFEKEIPLKSGLMKSQTDNLTSDSTNNKLQGYKDKLDAFAQTLADITDKFIETGTDEFVYGEAASDNTLGTITSIGLFSGASVKTLKFNDNAINDLNQKDLDYLGTLQWKKDISFDGKAQNASLDDTTSFSEFYQDVKVNVSSDKESINFLSDTQNEVQNSLQNAYEQLTKVDKDEEMVNLIKFQAAYTANAQIITTIDEMLQTILGLKR